MEKCPHCGVKRDPAKCAADPYINAEPRTYCPLARKHFEDECEKQDLQCAGLA